MSFSGKVVLITGASSGIGAAAAILFAKEGANVSMVGRNQSKLKNVVNKIKNTGKEPLVVIADIAKDEEVKKIIDETIAKFGRLDVLVNNAGFAKMGTILDGKILQAYDEIMEVNMHAIVNITMLAAPHLITTRGNIINISGAASKTTPVRPGSIAYGISKAALDQFTLGAAKELAPSGVRVNVINPGPVATDFQENSGIQAKYEDLQKLTALHRVSESQEIADLIFFLASDKAKGITGSSYVADNGYLLLR